MGDQVPVEASETLSGTILVNALQKITRYRSHPLLSTLADYGKVYIDIEMAPSEPGLLHSGDSVVQNGRQFGYSKATVQNEVGAELVGRILEAADELTKLLLCR
jgi:hypothetical protein